MFRHLYRSWSLFFSGEVLKFVEAQIYFFAVRLLISFQVLFISIVKRKAKSTIEQEKYKGYEKRDRILASKVKFNFQIFQRNKKITYRSSFLELVFLSKKFQW